MPKEINAPKEQPKLPPEVEAVLEQYHIETFYNRGFDASLSNHFRAAKEQLKVRLAAVLTPKE